MSVSTMPVTIDSPRWLDGWGEPLSSPRPAPALRLVDGAGGRRPGMVVHRRRRLVAVMLAGLALAAALAVASAALTRPVAAGSLPTSRVVHVVEPGDTYWSIAADRGPDGDLRLAVDELIDANGGRPLHPGDHIELP